MVERSHLNKKHNQGQAKKTLQDRMRAGTTHEFCNSCPLMKTGACKKVDVHVKARHTAIDMIKPSNP
jgi:hypothetical protein